MQFAFDLLATNFSDVHIQLLELLYDTL